jgi:HK97 family phage prohead protease
MASHKYRIKSGAAESRTATVALQQKTLTDEGQFEGYGSVFGVRDSYDEIVAEGAFRESLTEHRNNGTWPALLWQHDAARPIGTYVEMREDKKGLFVRGQLALETQAGREAHALLKAGALNGLSIGFMPRKWEYDEDEDVRTLTSIDLWECSLVTFPANGAARVSGTKARAEINGLNNLKSVEAYLRDEGGFSARSATAMVATIKRLRDQERDALDARVRLKKSSERLLASLKS